MYCSDRYMIMETARVVDKSLHLNISNLSKPCPCVHEYEYAGQRKFAFLIVLSYSKDT